MTTGVKLWMDSDEEREERKRLKEKRQRQLKKPQKKPLMLPTPTLLLKIHMLQPQNLQPQQLLPLPPQQLQSIQHQNQYTQLKDQTNQINLIPDMLPNHLTLNQITHMPMVVRTTIFMVQVMLPTELPTTTVSTMEWDMAEMIMAKKKIQIQIGQILGASTATLQTLKIATKLPNTWIVLKMKVLAWLKSENETENSKVFAWDVNKLELARHKKPKTSGNPDNVDQMQPMVHQSVANAVTNPVAQKTSILIQKQNGERI